MVRGAISGLVVLALAGCGDDSGDDDGLTGFGPGSTGSGGEGGATEAASPTSAPGEGSSEPTTASGGDGTTVAGPGSDGATTEPPVGSSGEGSSGEESEATGAPPGGGELGECLGTGAWQSCAQWCSANDAACVEGGCDGATVVYYGDVDTCTSMGVGNGDAQACDADFQMGGGISFARCCCA